MRSGGTTGRLPTRASTGLVSLTAGGGAGCLTVARDGGDGGCLHDDALERAASEGHEDGVPRPQLYSWRHGVGEGAAVRQPGVYGDVNVGGVHGKAMATPRGVASLYQHERSSGYRAG